MKYSNLEDVKNFFENNISILTFVTNNEDETKNIAKNFAKYLKLGDIVVLNGELGSGKTVFLSGVASYFNIENEVSSPTFTIVNEYDTVLCPLYHFDVYRLQDSDEFLEGIGTDYFNNGICIIEWGNIIKEILPKNTIYIDITKDENNQNIRYFKIWRDEK